jgi:flagellar biosynthetic protein FlhB
MSGGGGGEKTEKPTQKRLQEARKEGNVPRSPDVGSWLAVLAATILVPKAATAVSGVVAGLLMQSTAAIADPSPERAVALLGNGLRDGFMALLPMGAAAVLIAIAAAGAQGGLYPATKRLKPSFASLNLLKGVKRLFGLQTAWEALKILLKTAALGLVLWGVVSGLVPKLSSGAAQPLSSTLAVTGGGVLALVRASVIVGLALAIGDYLVKRRQINKKIRMSKHEISQENKQSEGDPHLKGARRSKQLAISRNRMMADIASADVVMVNPTHVAVALRYTPGKGAPKVVAKGKGPVATAIRERAEAERVPIVQDVPLARALHAACEVGDEIPAPLYTAVAQVLAFVMGLKAPGVSAGLPVPTR